MTIAWGLAKVAAVVFILSSVFLLLPEANDHEAFEIPTLIYVPMAAILKLDAVFPFGVAFVIAGYTVARQAALLVLWLWSFITRHVVSS